MRTSSELRGPDSGTIIFFDMDGTLTEPRGSLSEKVLQSLRKLSSHAEIGIVTGSSFEYMKQQIGVLLRDELRFRLHLLPCNGTIYYAPIHVKTEHSFELAHECNMEKELGSEKFNYLMQELIYRQAAIIGYSDFPLTGHFIDYRGSMINWCPIGRNAKTIEREKFKTFLEKNENFRNWQISILKERLSLKDMMDSLELKLGGDTSVDIYPKGWDKTYALKHFPDLTVWFVGDRCTGSGNDKEIYDFLKKDNRAFETTSPERTVEIIEGIIIPCLRSN